ncbi:MAG: hypothetical protein ABIC91_03625 [Nanoarchaeota archaeon]|nr:hypothetical protein [Nanoarchaeota archaeon]MBU1031174.1 hypothetical protein [Nanoarchaeota archaeon]MBU1849673.1 hypothetical protein [Nanoarchaeota archaeon]
MTAEKKHTLEKIASEMGAGFDEDKLHTAMLLSYASSVFGVMRSDNSVPSPLYRINYDTINNTVSLDEIYGKTLPPRNESLSISLTDEIFCSNIRDIPLLLEGETGVGKTYGAMKYLSTVLQKGNYFSHRLSSNAFLNNLFAHFQEGKMLNGMPVIEAKMDCINTTGGGIEDEINRGDSNEALQLFDNEMHLGGTVYKLGLLIPKFVNGKLVLQTDKRKKLLIVCAQNPAGVDDAKFTQTMQLDAAVDNRLLKTYVGNAAASAGSTLWLGSSKGKKHDRFLESLTNRAAAYLGVDKKMFSDLKDDWLSTYAWITDSKRTDKPILYSAMELSDLMIATFSGNLIEYYNYEKEVISEWNNLLGTDVKIVGDLQESVRIKQMHEVTNSFKVPIIFRDIIQIKKVADVLATLKNVKDALVSSNPVDTYLKNPRYVTVREVAGAMGLLARNKQINNSVSPMNAINEVLTQYVTLTQKFMIDAGYLAPNFDLYDPNVGIKKLALYKVLRDTITNGKTVDYVINKVVEQANNLTTKIKVSEDIQNVLIVRSVGDLMTFCGFLNEYKTEIDPIIKSADKKKGVFDLMSRIGDFYYKKLEDTAMVMPEIYQHRIQRTLGV